MQNIFSTPSPRTLAFMVALLGATLLSRPVSAQMRDSDPEAAAAFAKVIAEIRKAPRAVEETLVVTTREGELEESAPKVTLLWTNVPGKGLKAEFGGFRIRLADGRMQAVHESRDDLAVDLEDRGSPYYALFTQFGDLPWPGLAMSIGEAVPEDCAMQLNSRAPWLQPTGVVAADPGANRNPRIEFSSDIEKMWLEVDSKTGLPTRAEVVIHGGRMVPEGVEILFDYQWTFKPVDDPARALALPIEGRERVDVVGALERRAEVAAGEPGGDGGLVPGRKAPLFDLPDLDAGLPEVSLQALRGRVVVLDFWATWCGPCRAALPRMAALGRWADENGMPVEVLAVNTSEQSRTLDLRRKRIATFVEEQKLDAEGMGMVLDLDGSVADAYAVRGLPTTVVIDAAGRVVTVKTGFGPGSEERLKQDLLDLFEGGDREPAAEGDGLT